MISSGPLDFMDYTRAQMIILNHVFNLYGRQVNDTVVRMTQSYLRLIIGYSCDMESTQVRYSYSGSRYYVDVRAICIIWGSSRGWLDTDDDQH